jgi:hypothetical protein
VTNAGTAGLDVMARQALGFALEVQVQNMD